jgi:hypothetical protein
MYPPNLCTVSFSQRGADPNQTNVYSELDESKIQVIVQRDVRDIAEVEQLDQPKRVFSVLAVFPFG